MPGERWCAGADQGPVLVASAQGGMDIEAVAHENPAAILNEPVNIKTGTSRACRCLFRPHSRTDWGVTSPAVCRPVV